MISIPDDTIKEAVNNGACVLASYSAAVEESMRFTDRFGNDFNLTRKYDSDNGREFLSFPRALDEFSGVPVLPRTDYEIISKSQVTLRPNQVSGVTEAERILRNGESLIMKFGTGLGKTIMGIELAHRLGLKTLVLVSKTDIADQWVDACEKVMGLHSSEVGKIQANLYDVDKPVTIGFIQTIAGDRYKLADLETFSLLIIDECHQLGAPFFVNCMYKIPARLRLGLTATDRRSDGLWWLVEAHIGKVRVEGSAANLTPEIVVRYSNYQLPDWVTDLQPGKTGHITKQLAVLKSRNEIIISFIKKCVAHGRVIMVFADTKKHLTVLSDMLTDAGLDSVTGFYHGGLKKSYLEDVKSTKQVLLCTYQFTATGTDIPRADTAVLATPRSDVEQVIGRILRLKEGKRVPLVLDIVDGLVPLFYSYFKKRQTFYNDRGAKIHGNL